jgi:hypothetical protein
MCARLEEVSPVAEEFELSLRSLQRVATFDAAQRW